MAGSLRINSLHNHCWVKRWKNYENLSTFAEVMGKNSVLVFFKHGVFEYFNTFQICLLLIIIVWAPCGLRGCKNGPAPFPGRMSYKATKPGLVCLSYLSMFFFIVLLFISDILCIVSFRCYVFCLLVVLVKLSLLAKWLARKTPLTSWVISLTVLGTSETNLNKKLSWCWQRARRV